MRPLDDDELDAISGGLPVVPVAIAGGLALRGLGWIGGRAAIAYRGAWLRAATPHVHKEAAAIVGVVGGADFADQFATGYQAGRR